MLAAGGVLIGLGLLAVLAVGAKVIRSKEDVAAEQQQRAAQQRAEIQQTVTRNRRELGVNPQRGLELTVETALAGLAAGTSIGAAFGGGLGPVGAVIGAFVGAFVGLIKAAIDTESYGEIVRTSLRDWLRAGSLPASSAHVDAMLFRDGLLGADWVWLNLRTGELAVEILTLASGRREHFHDLPYPPMTSLGRADTPRNQMIPGKASWSVREMLAGANAERLDGPDQRRARKAWWAAMQIGDLYAIEFSTGHAAWNPSGSYTSGPGFRKLWPSLRSTPTERTDDWQKITPSAANIDALAAGFDAAAGVDWGTA